MPVSITAQSDYSGGEIEQTNGVTGCIASVVRDSANSTILVITPPAAANYEFLSGYTYRITPVRTGAATLKCDIDSQVPVADWEYSFCVGTTDAADINGDGAVNTSDFNILASHYLHVGCPISGDVNADGRVNTGDFNIVAGKFGATGIGTCESGALMRGGAGEDEEINQLEAVVVEMGFESLSDFSAWLDELPEKEQLDVLMEVIARLGE